MISDHADYRLISSRALKELSKFEEVNLFLRGLVPMVGFRSTVVFYERRARIAGESHYQLGKMLGLGIIGEYVGKIYLETKKRPRFIVEERLI